MSIHEEVNLIIFRIDDDENDKPRAVEIPYLGGTLLKHGSFFEATGELLKLEKDQIILARTTADGCKELSRYQLKENSPQEMEYSVLSTMVDNLINEYDKERHNRGA